MLYHSDLRLVHRRFGVQCNQYVTDAAVLIMTSMLFQVNDSSMALLGAAHGDDYRHIVELVVNKMEVYCRKASLSTTSIRFAADAVCYIASPAT